MTFVSCGVMKHCYRSLLNVSVVQVGVTVKLFVELLKVQVIQ